MIPRPLRVSVIDDDPSVLTSLSRLLRSSGHVASGYASGQEFLDNVSATAPDCIVIDVNMPALDGFAVRDRAARIFPSTPVVFITAQEDIDLDDRARAAGSQLLRKPFRAEDLVHAVEGASERNREGEVPSDGERETPALSGEPSRRDGKGER
ncbi:MAG: response regulator [Thermoanaerobaculia bacterium]|jgi:FixJ family two-component response regulator